MSDTIHYEVFIRRVPGAAWKLEMATENRAHAVKAAEELIGEKVVAAVRVTKETLDPSTGEYRSVPVFAKGDTTEGPKRKPNENLEPLCVSPQDLYTTHVRDRIGRLMEGWLSRNKVTPFELLHRPDLVEELDASGTDLQHAIQKMAVPEAQARGISTHEVMRVFQSLVERAISRIAKDAKRGAFPNFEKEKFGAAVLRLYAEPERAYLIGAGVAAYIAPAMTWGEKVNRLLDLADAAPEVPAARDAALAAIELPLAEILGSRAGMSDILGAAMDLGHCLAAMTRLVSAEQIEGLLKMDPALAKHIPELPGPAARLANWLDGPHFAVVRTAVAQRVLRELNGPRRLSPGDADNEIEMLRAMAMALTIAAGNVLEAEDIHEAFVTRSKMLVAADFVTALLGEGRSSFQEAEVLIRLAENVMGGANKRDAARYLAGIVEALRFEKEMRQAPHSPTSKLMTLAGLQKALTRARLIEGDIKTVRARIGEVGGLIETDGKLIALISRAPVSITDRLSVLIKMASGETAPTGPVADRARAEVGRLIRMPELRQELTSPEKAEEIREIMAALATLNAQAAPATKAA